MQNISKFLIGSNPPANSSYQLTLTIFERCEQYTIDSMVYLIGNEAAWTTVKKKWRSRLLEDEIPAGILT